MKNVNITYTTVNGRTYAYTCTSKRVPGKKNPVSRRVYLGVVDPDTGEIIPKRGGSESEFITDSGFTVRSWGDASVIHAAMGAIGLIDDVTDVFGDKGSEILAAVMAMAIRPSSIDTMWITFANVGIRDCLGFEGIDPSKIKGSIKSIRWEDAISFFRRRGERTSGNLSLLYVSEIRSKILSKDFSSSNIAYGGSKNTKSKASPTPRKSLKQSAPAMRIEGVSPAERKAFPTAATFILKASRALLSDSTKRTLAAPRLAASSPYAPVPAKMSRTLEPIIALPSDENIACRAASVAGRVESPRGEFREIPLALPDVILINS